MLSISGISWATPLWLLGVYGFIRYIIRPKNDRPGEISWSPLETVGVTVFIYFAGQIVGALLIYLLPLAFGYNTEQIANLLDKNNYYQFLLVLVVELLTLGLLYLYLIKRQASLKTIGLVRRPKLLDLGYVIAGYVVYFAIYLGVLSLLKSLIPQVDTNQQQVIGFDGAHGLQLPLVFISLVILPPFVEEIMVRGYLYSGLKKGIPIILAAVITSIMFAMAHLQAGNDVPLLWTAAVDTFILSMVLIFLREKTGSLWASIGLHMLKNGIAFFALFVLHMV